MSFSVFSETSAAGQLGRGAGGYTFSGSSTDTSEEEFLKRRIIPFVWLAVSFRPQYLIESNTCIALLFRR
jgi:hypothetical protein